MKTIYVDSRDRVQGTSPCDFTVQLPSTWDLTGRRMRCDLLRMPISVPTIQAGKNDTFVVRLGSQDYTVTLSQGQKTGPDLASELQSLLQAAAPGSWTVAYDVANIALRVQCSNNFTVVGGTYAAQLMSRAYTTTANSIRFSYCPVLGEDVVFLCSKDFAGLDNVGPNHAHDILLPCTITAPFGSVQEFNMPQDTWHDCPSVSLNQLSFQLRDRDYNLMTDFVPNISFLMTID
jgi:hypothetical protein